MVISVQQKKKFAFALDFEKKKVFNLFLKQPMESSGSRKSSGSEFQTVGEAWKKPRGPIVDSIDLIDHDQILFWDQ